MDDRLWANMIWSHYDLLAMNKEELNDPVLYDLLKAGVFDWEKPDEHLNQSTQAIRHSTAVQMRMLGKHLQLEKQVRVTFLCCLSHELIILVARSIGGGIQGGHCCQTGSLREPQAGD